MNHTFSILFWLQNHKISPISGCAPISARITVNGKRAELSTGKKTSIDSWNHNTGRVRGNSEEARIINRVLNNLRNKIESIHDELERSEQFISALSIKNIYLGKNNEQHSVVELFKHHNNQIEAQLGKEYSAGTLERYRTTLKHLEAFILFEYKSEDYHLRNLNYSFISQFEFFLKATRGIGHNTTVKYLRNFKKIILLAVKNDWLTKDPFMGYKLSLKEVKKEFLTDEELNSIYIKDFKIDRLDQVRDVFVFCCYTGLAYADVQKLDGGNITRGIDGEVWINVDRTKTGTSSNVPLLPIALEILNKYENHPVTKNSGKLLPVVSNQKINAYLKELQNLCNISKNITFHMARHTFATTVTLSNGVAIETVSKMLGHTNLRTTQIYAKVVQEKVSKDMQKLKSKLTKKAIKRASNQ
ncbi:site-specific integrase [Reichenbachiella agariperforans]|uniref:site-specific integrase n=1 Tax=Reichenbachiella agariperforans TaxID=156994 RepID=UPI002091703B|nr:site-specific integrase [Reichenbachiella agariperforans]